MLQFKCDPSGLISSFLDYVVDECEVLERGKTLVNLGHLNNGAHKCWFEWTQGGVMANDPVRYYVSSEDYSSNRIQFGDDIGGNVVFGLHI